MEIIPSIFGLIFEKLNLRTKSDLVSNGQYLTRHSRVVREIISWTFITTNLNFSTAHTFFAVFGL